MVSIVIL